ncbi:MAG: glycosyltransferase family 4 protein [Planctomycetes bacterium]|nr:glycosyltransferase family 4 protein [Planctomycetota bacterium]
MSQNGSTSLNGRCADPLVVGFVFTTDPADRDAISGMPVYMAEALAARGNTVVPLPTVTADTGLSRAARRIRPALLRPLPPVLRPTLRRLRADASDSLAQCFPRLSCTRASRRQHHLRDHFTRLLGRTHVDVLFGACISTALATLETDLPIVYFSDTTARLINAEYPFYARRNRAYKRACDRIESAAIARASLAVFASARARDSAVHDYGLPSGCAHVVPMGANITRADADGDGPDRNPPARSGLELCIVASDPARKRLDLAIDTTSRLRSMGYAATLTHVGPTTARALREPFVRCMGRLRLSQPDHRRRYAGILASSHLMLLPSAAETYGIAPCEAAHFGVPSIVSNVGGLPTVVEHNRTGLVMPVSAPAADYAQAIDALVGDAARYHRMCAAAEERAARVLNWQSWAQQITEHLRRAVTERRGGVRVQSSQASWSTPLCADPR